MKDKIKNSEFIFDFNFSLISLNFLNRTKEIGESSKTILQKKTNKISNQHPSTTISARRKTANPEENLQSIQLCSQRPLRFLVFFFFFFFY